MSHTSVLPTLTCLSCALTPAGAPCTWHSGGESHCRLVTLLPRSLLGMRRALHFTRGRGDRWGISSGPPWSQPNTQGPSLWPHCHLPDLRLWHRGSPAAVGPLVSAVSHRTRPLRVAREPGLGCCHRAQRLRVRLFWIPPSPPQDARGAGCGEGWDASGRIAGWEVTFEMSPGQGGLGRKSPAGQSWMDSVPRETMTPPSLNTQRVTRPGRGIGLLRVAQGAKQEQGACRAGLALGEGELCLHPCVRGCPAVDTVSSPSLREAPSWAKWHRADMTELGSPL